MAESVHINVHEEPESNENKKVHDSRKRITSLGSFLLIANFVLELPSAVFDQLSSVHKPQFALLSMLMSFTMLIISVIDLVYKARQQRVSLKKKGLLLWFYHPYPNSKPFGTFPDIIGLFFALFQWMFAVIAYIFVSRNVDNPIKFSALPIIFAFGLLYSKLSGNHVRTQNSSNLSKFHREEKFTLVELAAATDNFGPENKLGEGSFGVVYKGKLLDGRLVAIKRGKTGQKKFQEKESTFDSELAFLSRLHHKHLVRLVGYCEDGDEMLLVYEYMKNGALYDHLHNPENSNGVINSWKMRIKIALDAARGIEYLHSYAVPPIIHRDITSLNILLDENWTARVSDFGLSLMSPESQKDYRTTEVAGTVGYIDPEYYGLNVLTAKSDVYSLGVVMLELLTGKRAIFKDEENENIPTSIVDFTVPKILADEWGKLLDSRVGGPEVNEAEAVELVAYTAVHCVNLEGKYRPKMNDIVANLERALSLFEESHESISSATVSVASE